MTKSAKKPAVSAMTAAMTMRNPVVAKIWLDVMNESARFVSDRLQEDLETQKAMLRCKNPVEVVQLQSEFFRKAIEQYASEAQRIFEIMTEATDETFKKAGAGMKRGYDDVPL